MFLPYMLFNLIEMDSSWQERATITLDHVRPSVSTAVHILGRYLAAAFNLTT